MATMHNENEWFEDLVTRVAMFVSVINKEVAETDVIVDKNVLSSI